MRGLFIVLMLVSVLTGCAAPGPTISYPQNLESRSQVFVEGKTNYSEIIAELGKPQWEGVLPDGRKSIAYIDGNDRRVTITRVQFTFNDKDILEIKFLAKLNFK